MKDKDRFVFYEYLLFFWRKKLWFLPLPILLIIAAVVFSLMTDKVYHGQTTVFTGGVTMKKTLLYPDIVTVNYGEKVDQDKNLKFSVTAVTGRMTFNLTGTDKEAIKEELESLSSTYEKELLNAYEEELEIKDEHLTGLIETIKVKEANIEDLKSLVASANEKEKQNYLDFIRQEEEAVLDYKDDVSDIKSEKINFEKPQFLSESITEKSSFLTSNLLVATILGLFVSLLLLTLWKYIQDARRFTNQ
ncbi:hypothetical protein H4O14_01515 [Bacillus sp. PAMC26568]|nr:hypothetical protein H4O14_01515 [Bacillus sp. PAMC26568]